MSLPNYKEMYLMLMNATEDAIRRLIEAQQRCEEMYISSGEEEEEKESAQKN